MKTISKDARIEKFFDDCRMKTAPADDKGPGWIEGYLAVFGNVDCQGDRILKGAFAKTIMERVPAGKVPLMMRHFSQGGSALDVIGLITSAREDEFGLWIHADMAPDEESQACRQKVAGGFVKGLSVGMQVIRYEPVIENENTVYELKECKLLEGTITPFPANEQAGVTSSKSDSFMERLDKLEQKLEQLVTAKTQGVQGKSPASDSAPCHDDLTAAQLEIQRNRTLIERMKI